MFTPQEIRLRQAIWAEYQSNRNKQQTLDKVQQKSGSDSISRSTIDSYYRDLQNDFTFLFCKGTKKSKYAVVPVIQNMPNGEEVRKFQFLILKIHPLERHYSIDIICL
jgi:hypothetical protein